MEEIYKDIKDYEGKYQVSNFGQILSLNFGRTGKPKLLKPGKNKKGYLLVLLCKDGKPKTFIVHRLVAKTFIPNPGNLPQVNHKDENKANNRVENLEWCNYEYNNNYGTRNERAGKAISKVKKRIPNIKTSKKVLQLSLSGELIHEWSSINECGRNGFNQGSVCQCCNGKQKTHKGFKWCYS